MAAASLWPEPEQMASAFLDVTARPVPGAPSSLRSSPAAMLRLEVLEFSQARNTPLSGTAPPVLFVPSLNRRAVAAVKPSQKMLMLSLSRPEALDSRAFSQLLDVRSLAVTPVQAPRTS